MADIGTNVYQIGDEPYQFKQKFHDVLVAVDENRQRGIESLMQIENPPEVILLDDAYQHRKVKAGFNILLTTYNKLYVNDWVLPTGNLREPRSGAQRANVVVVTKCPDKLSSSEKNSIAKKLHLKPHQKLFFSTIVYDDVVLNDSGRMALKQLKSEVFTLVTGIANAQPLVNFLRDQELHFEHLNFTDHHEFSEKELTRLDKNQLIITTEKDFTRLNGKLKKCQLYYLPIKVEIDNNSSFEELIKSYVC